MPSAPADSSRIEQFDGLRTLAFAAVFLHHLAGAPLLWAGVDLFFVLSGFLITGILLRQRGSPHYFRRFYFRRLLRIVPPYYLILGIAFLVEPGCRNGFAWQVLYLSNVHDAVVGPSCSALGPMWSLSVEEQFYLLWPLLVWVFAERGMARLAVGLVVAAPVLRLALTFMVRGQNVVYMLLPPRVDLLAAGALLMIVARRSPELFRRVSAAAPAAVAVALAAFVVLARLDPHFRTSAQEPLFNTLGYSLVGVAAVGVVAYTAVSRDNLYFRFLTSRPAVYLGKVSYMMYLSHQGLLDLAKRVHAPLPVQGLLAFGLVVAWSTLSWFMFEKPLLALKDRQPTSAKSASA